MWGRQATTLLGLSGNRTAIDNIAEDAAPWGSTPSPSHQCHCNVALSVTARQQMMYPELHLVMLRYSFSRLEIGLCRPAVCHRIVDHHRHSQGRGC